MRVKKKIMRVATLGMMVIMLFAVTGCRRIPEGFARASVFNHPIVDAQTSLSGHHGINFSLRSQFPDANYINSGIWGTHQFFVYHEQAYYVRIPDDSRLNGGVTSVFSTNGPHIGNLTSQTNSRANGFAINITFLEGNYIYFQLQDILIFRRWIGIYDMSTHITYTKFSFHRFSLETGINEEVELEHFFEKLQLHSPNIKLNPNFNI